MQHYQEYEDGMTIHYQLWQILCLSIQASTSRLTFTFDLPALKWNRQLQLTVTL